MNKPLSKQYIEDHFIGNPQHNNKIYLEEYNNNWPILFEREKQRIKKAVQDKALAIEHIGSTAIPGLIAKPIIDILLMVEDAGLEAEYLPQLEKQGYVLRIKEPEHQNHHMFKGPDTDINLHVFSKSSKEIERYLVFRDYLRSNQEARELYAKTKLALSKKTWKYVQNYADAKSEVVEKIIKEAFQQQEK